MLAFVSVNEHPLLDQRETILNLEHQIKRAPLTLLMRIKNTLMAQEQLHLKVARDGDEDANNDGSWSW